ncbi:MAG: DUF308 domain-containing protein [Sphaerochaetaceae bacterium]|nr:DUF308 domain-containing protein [Sphaerochaetaceae bacterium]
MEKQGFFKRNLIVSMIFGIIVAILGIFLLFQGLEIISFVVLLYGLYSIYIGVKGLLLVPKIQEQRHTKNINIFSSIFSIIIGIIIIVYPYFISKSITTVVIYLLAAQLLISGLGNILSSFGLKNTSFYSSSMLASGLVNLVIAAVFFIFPSQVAQFFLKVIGIICIFYGIGLFLWSLRLKKVEKEFEKKNVEGDFEPMN